MTQEAIGKFIAESRENKKLTQAMLAKSLSVSPGTVASWEEGHSTPSADLIEPLCRIIEVQVSELLAGKKLKDTDKIERGEKAAGTVLALKAGLKLLEIFAIVLIILGGVTVVTVWTLPLQFSARVIPVFAGLATAGFGVAFFVLFGNMKKRMEKE
ncbi:MAG: helix-turn-helix transcriptional regulator [Lachnospiraceae bacterium]|nr:helix-turn-helix transcriptional regulator [Lachnospiraceae bacterium]